MIYVALTFWLLVIVLTAWGVHHLWSGMVKRKVFNTLLLPGTLVAQTGHVLGMLVTGATIRETTLIKDDDSGEPTTTANPEPRIPVVGPVIIGMLPLLACSLAIYYVARLLGTSALTSIGSDPVGPTLPTSLPGVWELLRNLVSLMERLVNTIAADNLLSWRSLLFWYLLVCLAIRIAPFPGHLRGSLGAIVVLGIVGGILARVVAMQEPIVQTGWSVLNLTVAMLLLLLVVSLLIRGGVGLVGLLREGE